MATELEALRKFRSDVGYILRDGGIAPLADIRAAEQASWTYSASLAYVGVTPHTGQGNDGGKPVTNPSTQLIISFKHYEHQGIDLKLVTAVGGGHILQVERTDNGNVLLKIELPKSTALIDRRS